MVSKNLDAIQLFFCFFSSLTAGWSYAQPRLWSHDFSSSHTSRSPVLVLCYRATRVNHHSCTSISTPSCRICLPIYTQTKYKLSTSAQLTLTTSKYGADRQRVKKHNVLQLTGFEPTSIATKAKSVAFRPLGSTVLEIIMNHQLKL